MTVFSDVLTQLMEKNHLRSIEICTALQMKKSYFSKMKNGTVLPKDFHVVEKMAAFMQLGMADRERLYTAYRVTSSGIQIQQIESALQRLLQIHQMEYFSCEQIEEEIQLSKTSAIRGKEHVLCLVRQVITTNQEENFYLQMQPEDPDLCTSICEALSQMPTHRNCHWLLYLQNRTRENICTENVEIFSKAVSLLLLEQVQCRYSYLDLGAFLSTQVFPNILVTSRYVVLWTKECDKAICLAGQSMVQIYRDSLEAIYKRAENFCTLYCDLQTLLSDRTENALPHIMKTENDVDLYILGKDPCMMWGADKMDMQQHLQTKEDGSEAYMLGVRYFDWYRKGAQSMRNCYCFFLYDSVSEYMHSEKYCYFSELISKPFSKEFRYRMLENMCEMMEKTDFFHYHALKFSRFDFSCVKLLNLWSNGTFLMAYDDGIRFRVLLTQEKSIPLTMITYLQYLRKENLVYTEGETQDMIRATFEKFSEDLKKCGGFSNGQN